MCNDARAGCWRPGTDGPQWAHHPSGGCCCGDAHGFAARAEKVEMLDEYRQQLERELAWVKERIEKLKAD